MTMASNKRRMRLGLIIDTEQEKVLYAATSKDGIEFLLNFFRLPLGTGAESSMCSLRNLNESSKNVVGETHLMNPQHLLSTSGLGILSGPSFLPERATIYAIKDDLELQLVPTMRLADVLDRLKINIKSLNVLRGEFVDLGTDEAIKILKASEETNMVLTTAFMEVVKNSKTE